MKEAVIVAALRSGGGRAKRGLLKDTRADDLIAQVMKAVMAKVPQVKPEMIDDVVLGCAFPEAEQGLNIGRLAPLLAGFSIKVPGYVLNRFCASGLQAISVAAQNIMCGWSDIVMAGGIESMSKVPMGGFVTRPNPEWTVE